MKKLSLILASALLLGGISFAAPLVKQVGAKPATAKQTKKPAAKATKAPATKAVPAKTATAAPAATKAVKKTPTKKTTSVKKSVK